MEKECILGENSPLRPVSLYAELKVNFEKYILEKEFNSLIPTILRFSTVYGVSPRMRFDLTVNHFTKDSFVDNKIVVFGEQFWRPYAHVTDIAKAIVLTLEAEENTINKNVFNVGCTEENYTKKMICEEITKMFPNTKVEYVKKDEDPRDYKVNFEKIKKTLGFKNNVTVKEGIKEVHNILKERVINDPQNPKYINK